MMFVQLICENNANELNDSGKKQIGFNGQCKIDCVNSEKVV